MRHEMLNQQQQQQQQESNNKLDVMEQVLNYADILGVSCKSQRIYIEDGKTRKGLHICKDKMLADKINNDQKNDDLSAYVYICAYVKQLHPVYRRLRMEHILHFCNEPTKELNMRTAEEWRQAIIHNKKLKCGGDNNIILVQPLPLLILLNPKSGTGKSKEFFNQHMVPLLEDANMTYDLEITTRANYARDLLRMRTNLVQQNSGIVVLSGDGLFHEVLNGIMEREDWKIILEKLPLGIVPCGSGNGLSSSIAHAYGEPKNDPKHAIFSCVSGQTTPMDVVCVEMENSKKLYSFLSIGWGMIADVDIKSEILRSIGPLRFSLWTLLALIKLRTYKGRISYLVSNKTKTIKNKFENIPPLSTPLTFNESGWQTEFGEFVMIHAAYTTHLSSDTYFVPQSRLNDGLIYLVIIRAGITRGEVLSMFTRVGNGTHFPPAEENHKYVSVIPVTAIRLEPELSTDGIVAVDGERIPYGSIQANIIPGAINVMVPSHKV